MPQAFLVSRRQYTKDKVNEYFEILMRKIFIQYIEDEFDVKIDTEEGLETVQDLVNYVDAQLADK